MRNLSLSVAVLVVIAGCGPSSQQLSKAKQTRYQGDKLAIFHAAKTTTEAKHKLLVSDETALGLQTAPRWFTADGMVSSGTDDNMQDVPDRAIRISLVVRMIPDGDAWLITVEPKMLRRLAGSPQPEQLAPTDPSVPGWATGQADTLQFQIHAALARFEVKAPGGAIAPGPASPDAPSPPAPAPAAPAPSAGAPTP